MIDWQMVKFRVRTFLFPRLAAAELRFLQREADPLSQPLWAAAWPAHGTGRPTVSEWEDAAIGLEMVARGGPLPTDLVARAFRRFAEIAARHARAMAEEERART